jgi:hypothetical protein
MLRANPWILTEGGLDAAAMGTVEGLHGLVADSLTDADVTTLLACEGGENAAADVASRVGRTGDTQSAQTKLNGFKAWMRETWQPGRSIYQLDALVLSRLASLLRVVPLVIQQSVDEEDVFSLTAVQSSPEVPASQMRAFCHLLHTGSHWELLAEATQELALSSFGQPVAAKVCSRRDFHVVSTWPSAWRPESMPAARLLTHRMPEGTMEDLLGVCSAAALSHHPTRGGYGSPSEPLAGGTAAAAAAAAASASVTSWDGPAPPSSYGKCSLCCCEEDFYACCAAEGEGASEQHQFCIECLGDAVHRLEHRGGWNPAHLARDLGTGRRLLGCPWEDGSTGRCSRKMPVGVEMAIVCRAEHENGPCERCEVQGVEVPQCGREWYVQASLRCDTKEDEDDPCSAFGMKAAAAGETRRKDLLKHWSTGLQNATTFGCPNCYTKYDPLYQFDILKDCKAIRCDPATGCGMNMCGWCFEVTFPFMEHQHLVVCSRNPHNMSTPMQKEEFGISMEEAWKLPCPATGSSHSVGSPVNKWYVPSTTVFDRVCSLSVRSRIRKFWTAMAIGCPDDDRGWLCVEVARQCDQQLKLAGLTVGAEGRGGMRSLDAAPYTNATCYGSAAVIGEAVEVEEEDDEDYVPGTMVRTADRPKTWSDDLYGAAGRMPVHLLAAFATGGVMDAAVAKLVEMEWSIALPADAASRDSESTVPRNVSMIAVAAGEVDLDVRLPPVHFVALGAQLDEQAVPGVGWNCDVLEQAPVRLRHVLAAQWITQLLAEKQAENAFNDVQGEMDVVQMLKDIKAPDIVTVVTFNASLSGRSSGGVDIEFRPHQQMGWRRAVTRVLHLRQQPGLWCCSHDSWPNEDRSRTSPGATSSSDASRLRELCGSWPVVSRGQVFPRTAAYFFQSPDGHHPDRPVELEPPCPAGGFDTDVNSNLHQAQVEWQQDVMAAGSLNGRIRPFEPLDRTREETLRQRLR